MIRILLADDQRVVRDGLGYILTSDPGIAIAGSAANGEEAILLADELNPNLVLMDLNMPGTNGVMATRTIKSRHPHMPVIILTTYATDEWLFDALRAGADGYLLKDIAAEDLIAAVKGTIEGQSFLDPSVTGRVLKGFACLGRPQQVNLEPGLLNAKEREILGLVARGLSNQEIADKVYLASGTVRNYISAILAKLGVQDRTQAAIIATRAGLLDQESNGGKG
jgi:DNA-binding NarL/FixJ family response regulator